MTVLTTLGAHLVQNFWNKTMHRFSQPPWNPASSGIAPPKPKKSTKRNDDDKRDDIASVSWVMMILHHEALPDMLYRCCYARACVCVCLGVCKFANKEVEVALIYNFKNISA